MMMMDYLVLEKEEEVVEKQDEDKKSLYLIMCCSPDVGDCQKCHPELWNKSKKSWTSWKPRGERTRRKTNLLGSRKRRTYSKK